MDLVVGIVGTGDVARHHAAAIAQARNVRLGAVLSRQAPRARSFSVEFGCAAYDDATAFFADPGLDAVAICTPSGAHLEPALAAAAAGKHVLVEKPLEITPDRCDRMIAAAEHHGVVLSGVFQSRFSESSRAIRKAVVDGRFGSLVVADAEARFLRSQAYYDRGGWKGTHALDGGGALMNQGIHVVDLLLWFMGPVTTVSARVATRGHEKIEVEDTAVASFTFADGALGTLRATTSAFPGFQKRIELTGTRGSATLRERALPVWEFADPDPGDEDLRRRLSDARERHDCRHTGYDGGAADPMAISMEGHRRQYEEFADACLEGGSPPIDGREARRSVALVCAVYESARTGESVVLG